MNHIVKVISEVSDPSYHLVDIFNGNVIRLNDDISKKIYNDAISIDINISAEITSVNKNISQVTIDSLRNIMINSNEDQAIMSPKAVVALYCGGYVNLHIEEWKRKYPYVTEGYLLQQVKDQYKKMLVKAKKKNKTI